jgi:ribosomal-protein-alanine N-acetyltransferase
VRLEPLRRRHIPRCVELERQLFAGDSPWSAHAFHAELDAGGYYLAAMEDADVEGATSAGANTPAPGLLPTPPDDGVLAGYAGLALVGRPGEWEAEVHTIGVAPAYQGRGIGDALLRALLDHADTLAAPVLLEVRTDNAPAIALYDKHGFTTVGVRKRYYQPSGADAYTMRRPARTGVPGTAEEVHR